jgi:hypothetical protein
VYDLDPARPSLARALASPNVHFHAPVTRSQLAQYAASFDVCILPTPVTPFNLSRDPLKVYEYLACGKPVVTTDLEQLEGMPYVLRSRDAADFLANVECAAKMQIDHAALDRYLDQQTWGRRVDELIAAVDALPFSPRTTTQPPHGAMENVENELERWQAYTRHLERLAQDRATHTRELERALVQSSVANKLKRALTLKRET